MEAKNQGRNKNHDNDTCGHCADGQERLATTGAQITYGHTECKARTLRHHGTDSDIFHGLPSCAWPWTLTTSPGAMPCAFTIMRSWTVSPVSTGTPRSVG